MNAKLPTNSSDEQKHTPEDPQPTFIEKPIFKVHEIFDSVQFEGTYCGTPARFVRFAGCNMRDVCGEMCDTPQNNINVFDYTATELVECFLGAKHIVLTGGEPTLQPLFEIFAGIMAWRESNPLLRDEWTLHLETNGTWNDLAAFCDLCGGNNIPLWVTVSPKLTRDAKLLTIIADSISLANEIKVVYGGMNVSVWCEQVIEYTKWQEIDPSRIFIQPWVNPNTLSPAPKLLTHAIEFAKLHNVRLSVQTHKLLGLR